MPKGVKLSAEQNGYLRLLISLLLVTKIKIDFSKIKAYKIQNFGFIQKNELHVVKLHTNNTHTNFQSNIFIFGHAMVKEMGEGDEHHFLKCYFGISDCHM